MVLVKHHRHPLDRSQRVAVHDSTRSKKGIDGVPGGKHVGKTGEDVAFVVVRYGVIEVQGISGVRKERLLERYHQVLARNAACHLLSLGRGEIEAAGVLDVHIFIECEYDPGLLQRESEGSRKGIDIHYPGGDGVPFTSAGSLGGIRA